MWSSTLPPFFSVIDAELELLLTLHWSAAVQPDAGCERKAFGLMMLADSDPPAGAAAVIKPGELPLESFWVQFWST
jgi:hypothetical protein